MIPGDVAKDVEMWCVSTRGFNLSLTIKELGIQGHT